jgi:hypothetical protein
MDAGDAPVRVDGHEPIGVGGDPAGRAASQPREREDAVDLEAAAGGRMAIARGGPASSSA